MEINQVRYFLHLANNLNFTKAAQICGVSQPSLTRAIQKLEEELGGPLLYRDGRDTRLTALGKDVQEKFLSIDDCLEQVKKLAETSIRGSHRTLNIGVMATITATVFTEFFNMVMDQLSGVEINLHPMGKGEGSEQVLSGKYDACILPTEPAANLKLHVKHLFSEKLMVGCSSTHSFASLPSVQPEQLPHEVFIDRLACECQSQLVDYFMDREILMRPRFSAEREDWVQQMVVGSSAICILHEHSAFVPGIVVRPIAGLELSRNVVLVTVSGSGTPVELRQVVRMVDEFDWLAKQMTN